MFEDLSKTIARMIEGKIGRAVAGSASAGLKSISSLWRSSGGGSAAAGQGGEGRPEVPKDAASLQAAFDGFRQMSSALSGMIRNFAQPAAAAQGESPAGSMPGFAGTSPGGQPSQAGGTSSSQSNAEDHLRAAAQGLQQAASSIPALLRGLLGRQSQSETSGGPTSTPPGERTPDTDASGRSWPKGWHPSESGRAWARGGDEGTAASGSKQAEEHLANAAAGLAQIASSMPGIMRGILGRIGQFAVDHPGAAIRTTLGGLAGAAAMRTGGAAGLMEAGAVGLGMMSGPVGIGIAALAETVKILSGSVAANRQHIASAAPLAGLSGNMQTSFLSLAGADYARQSLRSAYLAESTGTAIGAQKGWDNEVNQWSMRWQEMKNNFSSIYVELGTSILSSIRNAIGLDDPGVKIKPDQLTREIDRIAHSQFAGQKFKSLPPQRRGGRLGGPAS